MSATDEPRSIVRITLAFGAAAPDLDALSALAHLAATLRAELSGVFIEDQDLLRLAALPVAREYFGSGAQRAIEIADMERQLKRQADLARAALMRSAELAGARWTFVTARGSLARELGGRVEQSQAVAVGLTGRARNPFQAPVRSRAVAVAYAGGSAAQRALELAQRLREALRRPMILLVPARTPDAAEALLQDALTHLRVPPSRVFTVSGAKLSDVVLAARTLSPALLLLEASESVMTADAISYMNDELPCPALLVR